MSHFNRLTLLTCISLTVAACAQHDSATSTSASANYGLTKPCATTPRDELGEPSSGAEGMPGATGTCELRPDDWQPGQTTYWEDTDGIAPGVAGYHLGTDSQGTSNQRMFAEACRDDGLLIESNPSKNELHDHANDTGHPDTFDCKLWCVGTGHSGGYCQATYDSKLGASAKCACSAH